MAGRIQYFIAGALVKSSALRATFLNPTRVLLTGIFITSSGTSMELSTNISAAMNEVILKKSRVYQSRE
jgi:hypothetical protein